MIQREARRGDGRVVNILIPETAEDAAELQRLYDSGKLQVGDDVKGGPLSVSKEFDPDQPRDEQGRWTEGGSGGEAPRPMSEDERTDSRLAASRTRTEAEKILFQQDRSAEAKEADLTALRGELHRALRNGPGQVSTLYSRQGDSLKIEKDAQAATIMGEMRRSIANLPQGVVDGIEARGGLRLDITDTRKDFTVDTPGGSKVEFTQGGSAKWEGRDGQPIVEINISGKGGPGAFLETLDHEMGHITIDAVGDTTRLGDRVSAAAEISSDLADFRRTNRRAEGEVMVGDVLPNHALAGESMNSALYELQRWSEGEASRLNDLGLNRHGALRSFEKAITSEGGVTEYAETWNKDPRYGSGGTVRDPVHRGAHESFAEIEAGYAKVAKVADVTPKGFADMMAMGVDVPIRGWISKARPQTAATWLAVREHAEKWSPTSRIPKRIKALAGLVRDLEARWHFPQFLKFKQHFDKLTGRD